MTTTKKTAAEYQALAATTEYKATAKIVASRFTSAWGSGWRSCLSLDVARGLVDAEVLRCVTSLMSTGTAGDVIEYAIALSIASRKALNLSDG